nr:MAG TPA: hypothetical protein [Caudoviricetes sp.]
MQIKLFLFHTFSRELLIVPGLLLFIALFGRVNSNALNLLASIPFQVLCF